MTQKINIETNSIKGALSSYRGAHPVKTVGSSIASSVLSGLSNTNGIPPIGEKHTVVMQSDSRHGNKITSEGKYVQIPSGKLQVLVTQINALAAQLLSQDQSKPKSLQGRAVEWSGGAGYLWLDFAGIFRNGEGFTAAALGNHSNPAVGLSGISSAVMVITGMKAASMGIETFKTAYKVDDAIGIFSGAVLTVRGSLETFVGIIAVPMRSLNFVASLVAMKTVSVAATSFTAFSNGCGGFVYAFLMVPFIVNTVRAFKFGKGLDKALEEAIGPNTKTAKLREYLDEKLHLTDEERDKLGKKLFEDPKRLERVVSVAKADDITEMELLSDKDLKMIEKLTSEYFMQCILQHNDLQSSIDRREKVKQQLKVDFAKKISQKQADVKRSIGVPAFEKAKAFLQLNPLKQVEQIEEITEVIQKGNQFSKILGIVIAIGCIIGVIAAIASMPFGGPAIIAVIAAGLFLLSSLYWLAVDGYFVYKAFNEIQPGRWDKLLLLAMSTIFLISILAVTVFSGGLVGFAIAGGLAVAWLSFSAYSYMHLKKKEQEALDAEKKRLEEIANDGTGQEKVV